MSYGFDMGFAQANSLQEAMAIALEYTQSQMTEKNIRKTIRDNLYYIPSVRTGYIADEESKNRRADTLADTADRYWLEAYYAEDEFDDAHIAERATDILDNLAEIFGFDEQED